ncbi:MAG: polysaccharide deacetylase family protein, partial [Acidobacteria bacterium]|nr:polysaccharide deacetylase family protein [Acidobacteriota bacterium]
VLIGFPSDELWSVRPDRLDGWIFRYLTAELPVAVAAPLRHTAVLRMDDPQTSSKIWNTEAPPPYPTRYPGLTAAEWAEIGRLVGVHQARLSVMYVSGFVDDGDGQAGTLYLQGRPISDRTCGRIYDVRDVTYRLADRVYDFPAEFQALRDLVARDIVDIESHGYIHTTPFLQDWCRDPQRSRHFLWISEFFDLYRQRPVPTATQQAHLQASIDRIRRWFGRAPVAFSPPMHAYDEATPVIAQQLGLAVMHAQTLFDLTRTPILETARLMVHWAHLPYVEDPDLNESGYPIVIGLHEWDLRTHVPPIRWIHHQIVFFQQRGYRRIISFRELAGYLGARVQARYWPKPDREEVVLTVRIDRTGGPGGPESRFFSHHPMRWTLYAPGRDVVRVVDAQGRSLNYYIDAPGVFTLEFPPFGSQSERTMTVTLKRS